MNLFKKCKTMLFTMKLLILVIVVSIIGLTACGRGRNDTSESTSDPAASTVPDSIGSVPYQESAPPVYYSDTVPDPSEYESIPPAGSAVHAVPVAVTMPRQTFAVGTGAGSHTYFAISEDGVLWGWGSNEQPVREFMSRVDFTGIIGDGSTVAYHDTPVKIMEDVVSVATSGLHTMAIRTDGSLWGWGYNNFGQVGDGTTTNHSTPVKIMEDVAAVSAALKFCRQGTMSGSTAAIRTDGTLWTWGINAYTPTQKMENVIAVFPTWSEWYVIQADNSMWRISTNVLGDGRPPEKFFEDVAAFSSGGSIITSCGSLFSIIATDFLITGEVLTMPHFGRNPSLIMGDAVAVSTHSSTTMVVRTDGSLWAWGRNASGRIGDGTITMIGFGADFMPITVADNDRSYPIHIMDDVRDVFISELRTMATKNDGSLWVWGHIQGDVNEYDGLNTHRLSPDHLMDDVRHVVKHGETALILQNDGTLWTWGGVSMEGFAMILHGRLEQVMENVRLP